MYSQYDEDDIVLAMIEGAALPCGNTVLEIGAWDPVTFSNSRALIERGWHAVLIEPSPGPLQNLVVAYADHGERVKVIAAAVGFEHGGLMKLNITDDAVSSADAETLEKWKDAGGYYGTLHVPQIGIPEILNQFGGFSVVSIDAEGTSVDLARAYLSTGARPLALIVEHDSRLVELLQEAQRAGYAAVHTNGTNVVLGLR